MREKSILSSLFLLAVCTLVFCSPSLASDSPQIQISGPSSASEGETVQLNATTTGGFDGEDYLWYVSYWSGDDLPFQVNSTGQVTGLHIGQGKITVYGEVSEASKTLDFYTDSGKEVTVFLSLHSVHVNGKNLEAEVDCEIKGQPSAGSKLYAGLLFEDTFYFLPGLTTDPQVFSENPQVGTHELVQFPITALPYDVTFAAAMVNSEGELTSNIASQLFPGKEINK